LRKRQANHNNTSGKLIYEVKTFTESASANSQKNSSFSTNAVALVVVEYLLVSLGVLGFVLHKLSGELQVAFLEVASKLIER
jgi:hypothetical protein